MKKREDLKILLVQIRDDVETLSEEWEAFAFHTGLRKEQIDTLRILDTGDYDTEKLVQYDALFVGGSSDDGDALICSEDMRPLFAKLAIKILNAARERKMPVFASCFGFQVAVVAYGGVLEYDKDLDEFGSLLFTVTEEGKKDILFRDTPNPFRAIVGHKKYATKLPEGMVCLVKTDVCPYHAMKSTDPDWDFWGFQFHPELTIKQLIDWLTRYKERYFEKEDDYQKALQGLVDVSHSNALLSKFVERVLLSE